MAWTTPTVRATGDLITAAIWNADLVNDLAYLHGDAGTVAIAATMTANGKGVLTWWDANKVIFDGQSESIAFDVSGVGTVTFNNTFASVVSVLVCSGEGGAADAPGVVSTTVSSAVVSWANHASANHVINWVAIGL